MPSVDRLLPEEAWPRYRRVLEAAQAAAIPFAIGGGIALSFYSGRLRESHDIDLYTLPGTKDRLVSLVTALGFGDLHSTEPYDRRWIYRGTQDGWILDVMWQMANFKNVVERSWLERASPILVDGLALSVLPVEVLIWTKLHVLQRDRCDWPGLLGVVHRNVEGIDWPWLLRLVDDDKRLLGALFGVYAWLRPEGARRVPLTVWKALQGSPPSELVSAEEERRRVDELDSREWFVE